MAYFKLHIVFWEPGASLKMISSLRRTLQRLQYYWALIHLQFNLRSQFCLVLAETCSVRRK